MSVVAIPHYKQQPQVGRNFFTRFYHVSTDGYNAQPISVKMRTDCKNDAFTIDTIPSEVSWSELFAHNGTISAEDIHGTRFIADKLVGFKLLGGGCEQVVYDAGTIVLKVQLLNSATYGSAGHGLTPIKLVDKSSQYPHKYVKTRSIEITNLPSLGRERKDCGVLVQPKLRPIRQDDVPKHVIVDGNCEYGLDDRGRALIFDFG